MQSKRRCLAVSFPNSFPSLLAKLAIYFSLSSPSSATKHVNLMNFTLESEVSSSSGFVSHEILESAFASLNFLFHRIVLRLKCGRSLKLYHNTLDTCPLLIQCCLLESFLQVLWFLPSPDLIKNVRAARSLLRCVLGSHGLK